MAEPIIINSIEYSINYNSVCEVLDENEEPILIRIVELRRAPILYSFGSPHSIFCCFDSKRRVFESDVVAVYTLYDAPIRFVIDLKYTNSFNRSIRIEFKISGVRYVVYHTDKSNIFVEDDYFPSYGFEDYTLK